MSYVPLWCKSNYSFLEGASHPDELLEEAHRLGLRALALTDRDGVYGMVRAHTRAQALGVQLLCGAQLTVAAPGVTVAPSPVAWQPVRRGNLHAIDPATDDASAVVAAAHAAIPRGPGWGLHSDTAAARPVGYRRKPARREAQSSEAQLGFATVSPARDAGAAAATVAASAASAAASAAAAAPGTFWPSAARAGVLAPTVPALVAPEVTAQPLLATAERSQVSSSAAASAVSTGLALAPTSTVTVLASTREGWAHLVRLISLGRRRCAKGAALVTWDELCGHAAGLLLVWGGLGSLLVHAPVSVARTLGGQLREAFADRAYAMVTRHAQAGDRRREMHTRALAAALGLPTVAAREVLYHARGRRPLQDVLTCIRHGVTLADAGTLTRPNAEHDLLPIDTFARLWADAPADVARTTEVAARCAFRLTQLRYRYPAERLPDGSSSVAHLRALTWDGARQRYAGQVPSAVATQLEAELRVIEDLDYPGYFLTMYEIVAFCRRRGILCQGRGSAANSAVCYSLGITAVDPVRMGLLFERFLSRERAEPPDIDLDIEHERREEVIQHVYHVYGRDYAAMVCNVNRYRPKSALRDVGKVLGIAETALDRAAKMMSGWDRAIDVDALAAAGIAEAASSHALAAHAPVATPALAAAAPRGRPAATSAMPSAEPAVAPSVAWLARLAGELLDFPRHLSVHPGGFLLGHEPVHTIVPIENASMADRTVIQWDKDDIEALGLFKVDLLGLGALHHLHLCFDLLRTHRQVELTMATIPAEDPATYELMCAADTVGVFQIESRAQMAMLPRLRPRTFYDLVVEISLVRPGPISGGMVHPYLRRRRGLEAVEYPHPCLAPVLAKTLGVPLFQEQVMRLAVVAADYTPGEADQLRRDMAAWRRSGRIEQHRERLVSRMTAKGIAPEFAERVFEQIRGFGEYGFPESHAASFALIAYATAWLRCHYLAEFTCALLNALPMGFYSAATIVGDAQRHGITILPIDIQASQWEATLEPLPPSVYREGVPAVAAPADATAVRFAVRMGLRWAKGLARDEAQRLIAARTVAPFSSLEDLVRRARINGKTRELLASCGALGSLVPTRRDALWQVTGWGARQGQGLALGGEVGTDVEFSDLSQFEQILWDYQQSAHSTRGHPLAPLRHELQALGCPAAQRLNQQRDGSAVRYIGVVICRQRPATAAGVTFMTLEDETGFVNLVVWRPVYEAYALVARTATVLGVTGRLQVQEGIVHLIAEQLWVPSLSRAVAPMESRDFH